MYTYISLLGSQVAVILNSNHAVKPSSSNQVILFNKYVNKYKTICMIHTMVYNDGLRTDNMQLSWFVVFTAK